MRNDSPPTPSILALRAALASTPGNRELRLGLVAIYLRQGRFQEALAQARELQPAPGPDDPGGYLLAWALAGSGCLEEFWTLLSGEPRAAAWCLELGVSFGQGGHWRLAAELFRASLERAPGHLEAWAQCSVALDYLGDFAASEQVLEAAIERFPEQPAELARLRFHLGALHLLQGRFATGWALLENRTAMMPAAPLPLAEWRGQALAGRSLLLRWEQGFGDVFMGVRCAPLLAAQGARVLVESVPEAAAILATCAGVAQVIGSGDPVPGDALQVRMLSVPGVLGLGPDDLPAQVPYLQVPPVVPGRAAIDRALAGLPRPAIGLVWAGNPGHLRDAERSLPPELLDLLGALEGFSWVSLQKGDGPRPDLPLVELGPLLGDFADTAYALASLDGLITVDTAMAHLAGALGRPVWTLLTSLPDWRWMLARADSPWYPTMRLWRQPEPGDWATVLRAVVTRLGQRGMAPNPS